MGKQMEKPLQLENRSIFQLYFFVQRLRKYKTSSTARNEKSHSIPLIESTTFSSFE
jgi:hypothetical protein